MAHINGTNGRDSLHGTAKADIIKGKDGNDLLWGHDGNDLLTGGEGSDVYVLSAGGGTDTITDFNPAEGDQVVFSYDTALNPLFIGALSDGMTFSTQSGGSGSVAAGDFNGDGVGDTKVNVNDVSVIILGYDPEDLQGQMFIGG